MALIRALALDGPRMSCGDIDDAELYRLRRLRVDADYLLPGDFQGLASLRRLEVTVGRRPLPPGVFRGMPSLHRMELTVVARPGDRGWRYRGMLSPGAFEGLDLLEQMELNGRRGGAGFRLDRPNLRGLEGLVSLDVDSVSRATPDALSALPSLRRLRLTAVHVQPALRDSESPRLPPEFLESAARLENFRAQHFH